MDNIVDLKRKTVVSLIWKIFEKAASMTVTLVVSIILARLLEPSDYGIISLTMVFITISIVFVECGFSYALVQKKDLEENDVYTIFYVSLFVSAVIYTLLFICAPFIAAFYDLPQIVPIFRSLGIILFFGSFTSVLGALLQRELKIRKVFIANFSGIVISGIAGIALAVMGAGAWALVAQQLISKFVTAVILIIQNKWKIKMIFSFKKFKLMLPFASKVLFTTLITTAYSQLRVLIIGKQYNAETLAIYNKGVQIPSVLAMSTDYAVQNVMFSVYSKMQNNTEELKKCVRRTIKMSSFILFPMMIGIFAMARPIVIVLLTEKWLGCVPFLQITCIVCLTFLVTTACVQSVNALGRSDITLKNEIITRIFAAAAIIFSIFVNVYAMAFTAVLADLLNMTMGLIAVKKLIDYSPRELLMDILPVLIISIFMGVMIRLLEFLNVQYILLVFIQFMTGAGVYFLCAWIFKLESFNYLMNTGKEFLKKSEKKT